MHHSASMCCSTVSPLSSNLTLFVQMESGYGTRDHVTVLT